MANASISPNKPNTEQSKAVSSHRGPKAQHRFGLVHFSQVRRKNDAQLIRRRQLITIGRLQQGIRNFTQIASDDLVQVVQRQSDPMVGNAILRKIVGPDSFGSVTGSDLSASLVRSLCMVLREFLCVEP